MLVETHMLPLPDSSVDRLVCVHAIESSGNVRQALREIWRVLSPEGRVLVVVPNRRSIWSRSDHTPFGTGEPYSKGQLESLMSNGMFCIESCSFALALPPLSARPLLRKGESLERLGLALWPHFAGLIVVEASKQMMAGLPRNGLRVPLRSAAAVLGPRSVRLASRKERAHLPAPGPERRKTA